MLVVRPEQFIVKIKEEKCVIYERTEIESKSVKLAEFSYKEIDDVIVKKEKMKANLFKSSKINIFGQPCQEKIENAKEVQRK